MPIHGYPGGVITANPVAPTSTVATGVWTTEQQLQAVSQGNWPGYEYPLERSLRFNSADSAYLNRTAGSPTNQIKWTFSGWIKRSTFGAYSTILSGGSTVNDYSWYGFDNNDKFAILHVIGGTNQSDNNSASTMVFRDPSAWYHIVIVYDSANATSANRTILYVNGVQQTISALPSLNEASSVNANGIIQYIAQRGYSAIYNNGYMTELNFIDGQALTPSSFGLNDPETGVWSPKRYTGTYGTNGFYLNFSDNSGTTSTTLGKDSSGNGNNWTPNNFSVTAGAGNDSMVDSPTSYGTDTGVGGEVRGNYCTLNPLQNGGITITNGNLTWAGAGSSAKCATGSIAMTSGKWYFEALITGSSGGNWYSGVCNLSPTLTSAPSSTATGWGLLTGGGGTVLYKSNNNVLTSLSSSSVTGAVVSFAVDVDAGKIWFAQNGTWLEGSPSAGTGASYTNLTGTQIPYVAGYDSNDQGSINFGQRPFAYTAPSGFKALCTQNLPTPTIGATSTTQANKYFDVTTFTGNASTNTIVNSGSMQPDMVWLKSRSNANNHTLYDAVRGVNIQLYPNLTNAEDSGTGLLTSFNSNGFTLGASQNSNDNNGESSVGWQWRASNTTAVTNTAGSITSTVSANTTSGFSIVTYTGTGANATVGHGLGAAPSMVIVKNRSSVTSWRIYHINSNATPQNYTLYFDTSAATAESAAWNNTAPTSSVFSVGTNNSTNTINFVAYCFAAVAGYSAFGSYTGNGSTDGPFVYTGFRPRFILTKSSSSAFYWVIEDAARNPSNVVDLELFPNDSLAETNASRPIDFLSNGFKIRHTGNTQNASGGTYIYAAFAESPFKYALAR